MDMRPTVEAYCSDAINLLEFILLELNVYYCLLLKDKLIVREQFTDELINN